MKRREMRENKEKLQTKDEMEKFGESQKKKKYLIFIEILISRFVALSAQCFCFASFRLEFSVSFVWLCRQSWNKTRDDDIVNGTNEQERDEEEEEHSSRCNRCANNLMPWINFSVRFSCFSFCSIEFHSRTATNCFSLNAWNFFSFSLSSFLSAFSRWQTFHSWLVSTRFFFHFDWIATIHF